MTNSYPRTDLALAVNRRLPSAISPVPEMAGPLFRRVSSAIGSESSAVALYSSFFWQSFLYSDAYSDALANAGASPLSYTHGEAFIVRHGGRNGVSRHSLVVFDPGMGASQESISFNVSADANVHAVGWTRFLEDLTSSGLDPSHDESPATTNNMQILERYGLLELESIGEELARVEGFGVVVLPPSPLLLSGVPNPPASIQCQVATQPSTAGVTAVDNQGRKGVTAALHTLKSCSVVGGTVSVAGVQGTLLSVDRITDSCFIEVNIGALKGVQQTAGPLSGVTPRGNQSVDFYGLTSGAMSTLVTGWSPELPFVFPGSQLKVLTRADTSLGDSGAALIDPSDNVIGFAYYRTGFQSTPSFSAWIWAESVFQVHGLK